jgi:hypothetical protein
MRWRASCSYSEAATKRAARQRPGRPKSKLHAIDPVRHDAHFRRSSISEVLTKRVYQDQDSWDDAESLRDRHRSRDDFRLPLGHRERLPGYFSEDVGHRLPLDQEGVESSGKPARQVALIVGDDLAVDTANEGQHSNATPPWQA